MTAPRCDLCQYHRLVKRWQQLETGEWNEYQGSNCYHPNARAIRKPDKTGGVGVGHVCWSCRGEWK